MICDNCKNKDICKYVDEVPQLSKQVYIDKGIEAESPFYISCTKKVVEESKQVDIQRL